MLREANVTAAIANSFTDFEGYDLQKKFDPLSLSRPGSMHSNKFDSVYARIMTQTQATAQNDISFQSTVGPATLQFNQECISLSPSVNSNSPKLLLPELSRFKPKDSGSKFLADGVAQTPVAHPNTAPMPSYNVSLNTEENTSLTTLSRPTTASTVDTVIRPALQFQPAAVVRISNVANIKEPDTTFTTACSHSEMKSVLSTPKKAAVLSSGPTMEQSYNTSKHTFTTDSSRTPSTLPRQQTESNLSSPDLSRCSTYPAHAATSSIKNCAYDSKATLESCVMPRSLAPHPTSSLQKHSSFQPGNFDSFQMNAASFDDLVDTTNRVASTSAGVAELFKSSDEALIEMISTQRENSSSGTDASNVTALKQQAPLFTHTTSQKGSVASSASSLVVACGNLPVSFATKTDHKACSAKEHVHCCNPTGAIQQTFDAEALQEGCSVSLNLVGGAASLLKVPACSAVAPVPGLWCAARVATKDHYESKRRQLRDPVRSAETLIATYDIR